MVSLIQSVVILALVLMGSAVIVGVIEPPEATKRILIFLGFVFLAPPLAAILVRSFVLPTLDAVRSLVHPVLLIAMLLAIVIVALWIAFQFLKHRSGEES